jgi:hypothetical protein
MITTDKGILPRLTVVAQVHHQREGHPPLTLGGGYARKLASGGQPYERELVATEEWSILHTGWVGSPALVHVEPRGAVEVGVSPPGRPAVAFARLGPGEPLSWPAAPDALYHVRACEGTAGLKLTAIPE